MEWGDYINRRNTPERVRALYESPRVLTREDIAGEEMLLHTGEMED